VFGEGENDGGNEGDDEVEDKREEGDCGGGLTIAGIAVLCM
jgi:hypothetical protein